MIFYGKWWCTPARLEQRYLATYVHSEKEALYALDLLLHRWRFHLAHCSHNFLFRSDKLQTMTLERRPGLGEIFLAWLILGIQSFGGGSSTFYLIHQACIEHGWMDEQEFVRAWALAQISPGINLVKLTTLIGYQLRGWPGILAAMAGLLLPSGAVTALMTAGFAVIRSQPLIQAALRGILPATIGLSLAMGVQMAQPLLSEAHHEGRLRLSAHLLILLGAALLLALSSISPVVVLLLAGAAAVLLLALLPVGTDSPQQKDKDNG